ncbi:BUD13 homolog [Carya illinoinensis]|uniref:BUD13 homolog n=1 Tax=Carya illinoinensis TaxID=32201 RepID=UPI001C728947|nr:BUD13 homolog [Carya illinoinensis]
MVAASTSGSKSLIEYLKRYESNDEEGKEKKKRMKNVVQSKPDVKGVLVVDEDPVCHKPVNLEEENNDDSAVEEKPQVDEDIEVKQMKRLKQLKAMRPYNAISEDGSGWVSLSPKAANSNDPNPDMSPPGKPAILNDTPSPEHELKPADFGRGSADLSPSGQQLKHQQNDTTSDFPDISPPRQRSHGSLCQDDFQASPGSEAPRKTREDFRITRSSDLSPPCKRSTETNALCASLLQDLSPPRKSRKEAAVNEQHKTGLLTGKEISEEIARTKKTDWLRDGSIYKWSRCRTCISGQGAGESILKEDFLKSRQKVKVEEKPKEKKLEWGKGLAQKQEAEAKLQELELEKEKPFAQTRDDPELNNMLKERLRRGDPMVHLVKCRKSILKWFSQN